MSLCPYEKCPQRLKSVKEHTRISILYRSERDNSMCIHFKGFYKNGR